MCNVSVCALCRYVQCVVCVVVVCGCGVWVVVVCRTHSQDHCIQKQKDVHVGVNRFAHFLTKKRHRKHTFHDVCFTKPLTFHNGFMFLLLGTVSSTFSDFKPFLMSRSKKNMNHCGKSKTSNSTHHGKQVFQTAFFFFREKMSNKSEDTQHHTETRRKRRRKTDKDRERREDEQEGHGYSCRSHALVFNHFDIQSTARKSHCHGYSCRLPALVLNHFNIQSRRGYHYEGHGFSCRSPALVLNFSPL